MSTIQEANDLRIDQLLKILGYRNDETVHRHGELVHHDNEALQRLTLSARSEAEGTRTLLEGSVKDSRTLKSLTFIATIYLPANLVAVSISIFDICPLPALRLPLFRRLCQVYLSPLTPMYLWGRQSSTQAS